MFGRDKPVANPREAEVITKNGAKKGDEYSTEGAGADRAGAGRAGA